MAFRVKTTTKAKRDLDDISTRPLSREAGETGLRCFRDCTSEAPPLSRGVGDRVGQMATIRTLYPDHAHQLLHRVGALLQGGLLFWRQLDLDDLLNAVGAQLAGHANEQAVDTVLAFEIGRARHDLLLVLEAVSYTHLRAHETD